jgi:DNA-binding transcriptional LysR family regulator
MTTAEGFPDDLVERVRSNQIDVAFIRTPVANPEGVVIDVLQEDAMLVALPSGHALAQTIDGSGPALPLKALAGETFIMYGRGRGTLTMQSYATIAACQAAGFDPRVGHVAPDILSRLTLVAAGLGVSVVSALVQRINMEGVVYRRLRGVPQLKVPLSLVSRRGDTSAVVRRFRTSAKQTAKNYRTD